MSKRESKYIKPVLHLYELETIQVCTATSLEERHHAIERIVAYVSGKCREYLASVPSSLPSLREVGH